MTIKVKYTKQKNTNTIAHFQLLLNFTLLLSFLFTYSLLITHFLGFVHFVTEGVQQIVVTRRM